MEKPGSRGITRVYMSNPEISSGVLPPPPVPSEKAPKPKLNAKAVFDALQGKGHTKTIFLLLGLALFAYLVYKLKPSVLLQNLHSFGFNYIYILLISLAGFLCFTYAWHIFLKEMSKRVSFWEVFKIKISGETVGSLTPLAWGGGDPARILLLRNHVPVTAGTASVVVDRTLNSLAVALFMLIGVIIAFLKFRLPLNLEIALAAVIAVMAGLSIFFFIRSQEGLFEFFIDTLKKLRIKRNFSEKTLAHAREIDGYISEFYKMNKSGFLLAFALQFLGKATGVLEIYVAALVLKVPIGFIDSYLLLSMTVIVNMLFAFVPGSLGVQEGAFAGTFSLVNLNPVMGTSIQIIRRVRMVFWTALGFYFMSRMQRKNRNAAPQAG